MTAAAPVAGIVGKLPGHGDFVRRGGPAAVLARIDRWLDVELAAAVGHGIALDDAVVGLAGWRFAFDGADGATIAVAIASADKVGRCFPLVATLTGTAGFDPAAAEAWCAAAAAGIAEIRDAGGVADAALAALADIALPLAGDAPAAGWWRTGGPATGAGLPASEAFRSLLSAEAA